MDAARVAQNTLGLPSHARERGESRTKSPEGPGFRLWSGSTADLIGKHCSDNFRLVKRCFSNPDKDGTEREKLTCNRSGCYEFIRCPR
jgi:hypothetical protein